MALSQLSQVTSGSRVAEDLCDRSIALNEVLFVGRARREARETDNGNPGKASCSDVNREEGGGRELINSVKL